MTPLPFTRKKKHCKLAILWIKVNFFPFYPTCVKLRVGSTCGSVCGSASFWYQSGSESGYGSASKWKSGSGSASKRSDPQHWFFFPYLDLVVDIRQIIVTVCLFLIDVTYGFFIPCRKAWREERGQPSGTSRAWPCPPDSRLNQNDSVPCRLTRASSALSQLSGSPSWSRQELAADCILPKCPSSFECSTDHAPPWHSPPAGKDADLVLASSLRLLYDLSRISLPRSR